MPESIDKRFFPSVHPNTTYLKSPHRQKSTKYIVHQTCSKLLACVLYHLQTCVKVMCCKKWPFLTKWHHVRSTHSKETPFLMAAEQYDSVWQGGTLYDRGLGLQFSPWHNSLSCPSKKMLIFSVLYVVVSWP